METVKTLSLIILETILDSCMADFWNNQSRMWTYHWKSIKDIIDDDDIESVFINYIARYSPDDIQRVEIQTRKEHILNKYKNNIQYVTKSEECTTTT